jgi:hypothetical protein
MADMGAHGAGADTQVRRDPLVGDPQDVAQDDHVVRLHLPFPAPRPAVGPTPVTCQILDKV